MTKSLTNTHKIINKNTNWGVVCEISMFSYGIYTSTIIYYKIYNNKCPEYCKLLLCTSSVFFFLKPKHFIIVIYVVLTISENVDHDFSVIRAVSAARIEYVAHYRFTCDDCRQ